MKSNYPKRRCEALLREFNRITNSHIQWDDPFICLIKAFVKDEAYKEYKQARGIYSRSDAFKTLFGPICKLIENELYKNDKFAKHIPVEQKPRQIMERFGIYQGAVGPGLKQRIIGTDFTAFESHFTPEIMDHIEFILYDYMTQDLPEHKQFMGMCHRVIAGTNRIAFHDIHLSLKACRMSGEMNTSLGNGFTNLMIFLYLTRNCTNVDCLIEGDDCLGVYFGEELRLQDYEDLGFTVKIDYYISANLASFCGQVFDLESLTVITDPIKIIMNTSWSHAKYVHSNPKTRKQLLRSKAMSCLAQYPGCPVVQEFSNYLMRMTHGVKRRVDSSESYYRQGEIRNEKFEHKDVSLTSRQLMSDVFNVTIDEQIQLELYFKNLHKIGPLTHPVIYAHATDEQFDYNARYVMPMSGAMFHFGYDTMPTINTIVIRDLLNVWKSEKTK